LESTLLELRKLELFELLELSTMERKRKREIEKWKIERKIEARKSERKIEVWQIERKI